VTRRTDFRPHILCINRGEFSLSLRIPSSSSTISGTVSDIWLTFKCSHHFCCPKKSRTFPPAIFSTSPLVFQNPHLCPSLTVRCYPQELSLSPNASCFRRGIITLHYFTIGSNIIWLRHFQKVYFCIPGIPRGLLRN
jgi:hypothetical protein